MTWKLIGRRYERDDGAYVMKSRDEYHARPWLEGHKPWIAFTGADPKDDLSNGVPMSYRRTKHSRLSINRRWKTAEAAMKAVDREHPMDAGIVRP